MAHLLDVRNLEVVYHTQAGLLEALHDVSFNVQPGEIVGIVGESGCGKSTVAAALLRLLPPNGEIRQGKLELHGEDLMRLGRDELRRLRGRDLAMIFQDPMTSLNPVFSVGTQLIDVERAHPEVEAHGTRLRERAIAMLARVGIPDPDERLDRFPHQFSGGMRQRILVAMALMSRPALLIADEPTASLDVTLEAQILELMKELREAYQTAILFVAHDLGVIAQLCDRVIVMYAGRVVEQGDTYALFDRPLHPYTQALLAAVPSRKHHVERLATIPGVVPSLASLPAGCKFVDRCTRAQPLCESQEPDVCDVNSARWRRAHRALPHVRTGRQRVAGRRGAHSPGRTGRQERGGRRSGNAVAGNGVTGARTGPT